MKVVGLQAHPRFAEWRELLRCHPECFAPWTGTFFRFQTVEFPTPAEVLSGQGAARRGGRWNPPGLPALYGSTKDSVALEECKATDRYYGVVTKTPRLLVAVEAQLPRMVDLTAAAIRRNWGVTLNELGAEDWRKRLHAGQESLTQAIGRAVAACGGSGLLVRSAAVPHGVNVVVFPANGGQLRVVGGEKLAKLRS